MGKKLYVGNLAYGISDSDLQQMFEPHGTVQSAQVIMDRDTGRSKGFGFVEMGSDQEAQAAIQALNGQMVEGRALTVNEAKPREDRGGGGRVSFLSAFPLPLVKPLPFQGVMPPRRGRVAPVFSGRPRWARSCTWGTSPTG